MRTSEQRVEMYNKYFNQSKENIDLIMKSIKIKNELFNRGLIPNI